MRKYSALQLGVLVLAILAVVTFVPAASASVIGTLDIANCTGDGVTVTATAIDFLPGVSSGCIQTGSTTSLTYSGGTLGSGVSGTIKDLPGGNTGFMTFPAAPGLFFDLVTLGPGPSTTTCATSLGFGAPCAVVSGSPFSLSPTPTGTSITLSASGIARDAISATSIWTGNFTSSISKETPAEVQAMFLKGGFLTSTFQGNFSVTAIPEPFTLAMIGGGLIALASLRKRRLHQ